MHSAPATRRPDELFADLICSDPGLLRAEFDAIIAAQWPSVPPRRPGFGFRARRVPRRIRRTGNPLIGSRWSEPLPPGEDGWGRPRSPPP